MLLPTDGAALTDVATKAMEAGIPVVNVDREFSSPFAARTTVLGDNYGMGVSAGTYACQLIEDKGIADPVIAEIAGIDALPLTQDRSQGFADALEGAAARRSTTGSPPSSPSSPARRRPPTCSRPRRRSTSSGTTTTTRASASRPRFDNADRDEFAFIGGAGSCNAMRWIKDGEMEATVIYPPTQAADGIRLARLIAQDKGMSDLVQVEVPEADRAQRARSSPRTTSTSTCPSASSPDRRTGRVRTRPHRGTTRTTPKDIAMQPDTPRPSGVGMVGYAFMGAAHSQAWRTAPRFFDLPLQPRHAPPSAAATPAAVAAAADRLGWAVDRDRLDAR